MTHPTELKNICSDEEVAACFAGKDLGECDPREIIADTLIKIAGDFGTSYTATRCCQKLGLLGEGKAIQLTKKGRRYLYYAFVDKPRLRKD